MTRGRGAGIDRARRQDREVSSTEAQNNFGRVLVQAAAQGAVFITRYGRPAAVVLSIERYRELAGDDEPDLDELAREFDHTLTSMQTDKAAAAFDALFEMGPEELGRAAVHGARGDDR